VKKKGDQHTAKTRSSRTSLRRFDITVATKNAVDALQADDLHIYDKKVLRHAQMSLETPFAIGSL